MIRRLFFSSLAALMLLALPVKAERLPLVAEAIMPGLDTPPAVAAEGSILLSLPFSLISADRFYWDIPISRLLAADTEAIAIAFNCDLPGSMRAITAHLYDGHQWYDAQKSPSGSTTQTLLFQPGDFAPALPDGGFARMQLLRLSCWRAPGARNANLLLLAIQTDAPTIAILPEQNTANTALSTHFATRLQHLLATADLSSMILSTSPADADLSHTTLLLLPFNPELTDADVAALSRFLADGKTRIGVFYGSSKPLARLLGFSILPYIHQTEEWSAISFSKSSAVAGLPEYMVHRTANLLPIRADDRQAETVGNWQTLDGAADRSLPASAVSEKGFWFSHIPPLATPEAAQWLLALLAHTDAGRYAALRDQYRETLETRRRKGEQLLAATPAPENEIRAIWSLPIPPRAREKNMKLLANAGINTLFEHLSSAGHAHYEPENSNVPQSPQGKSRTRRYLPRALTFAADLGMEYHAWMIIGSLDGFPAETIAALDKQDRLMKNVQGDSIPWLCYAHPENIKLITNAMEDLAKMPAMAGLNMDYLRYPGTEGCYCALCRGILEADRGSHVENWPADVLPGGPLAKEFAKTRQDILTDFIRTAAEHCRSIRPDILLSASVYPSIEAASENGQDWPFWAKNGILDFICPMMYIPSTSAFDALLSINIHHTGGATRILPGLGYTADETQLDPLSLAEQIASTRQRKVRGFALFQFTPNVPLPPLQ